MAGAESGIDGVSESQDDCQQPLKLSEAEMKVLRECRVNSLYLRGLPLGLISAFGTRFVAHNFYPHMKRWAGFYYTVSFGMGVAIGVASYKDKCFEKIMSLENSQLADQVREFQRRAAGIGNAKGEFDTLTDRMHKKRGDAAALSTHTDSQLQHDATADAWNSSATGRFGSSKSNVGSNDDEEHQKKASYEEMRRLHRVKQTGGPRRPPAIAKQDKDDDKDTSSYDPDSAYDKQETWDTDYEKKVPDEKVNVPQSTGAWPQKKQRERTKTNQYGDEME